MFGLYKEEKALRGKHKFVIMGSFSKLSKEMTMNTIFRKIVVIAFLFVFVPLFVSTLMAFQPAAKPRIMVLATGGTIAGAAPTATQTVGYQAAVLPVGEVLASVPDLVGIADIQGEQVVQIASENMNPDIWMRIARRCEELLGRDNADGIVITHGTDTLEETAFFLNLTLKSRKPVVLVGAMRPATALSADGSLNLYNAVATAASPIARGQGVLVVMNDTINAAREVTKTSTFSVETFRSPDLGALGYVQSGRVHLYRGPSRRHTTDTPFYLRNIDKLPKVEILYGYAGSGTAAVEAAVKAGAAGIVYAGTGNGSLPEAAKAALASARKKGVFVVRSSRTGSGMVSRNGGVNDDDLGFIAADNLNPQKSRILLMLALTATRDAKVIQQFFDGY